MNTKNRFREIFRHIPEVYQRRKFYNKSFRYMEKNNKDKLMDISMFLWNLSTFDDSDIQLKAVIAKIYIMIKENQAYSWLPDIFIQSILYDMRSIPDAPILYRNLKYCINIASSLDIQSLYPKIIISDGQFNTMFQHTVENQIKIKKENFLKDS